MAKVPDLIIILNHAGFPLRGEHAEWRRGMELLAAQPNVACKIGGFGACDETAFTSEETRRYVGECLDLFGVERCLMESNLPVDSITLAPHERWEHLWAAVQGRGLTDEQLEMLFRGNCLRYYSIDKTAAAAPT